jgi:hypothetical protein
MVRESQAVLDANPTKGRIFAMSTVKVSATLDADNVAEAKKRVGARNFSRYLNESLAMRLQRARLEEMLEEMAEEFGPIPDEVRSRVEGQEWPR